MKLGNEDVKSYQLEVTTGLVSSRDVLVILVSAEQTRGLSWQLRNRLCNNHIPVAQVYGMWFRSLRVGSGYARLGSIVTGKTWLYCNWQVSSESYVAAVFEIGDNIRTVY